MVEQQCEKLSKMRTDTNRKRWSGLTCYRAPHKPFLLLSVLDLFAQGMITSHFIEPSPDLVDTFNTYWSNIMSAGASTSMAYPFPRLQNDGICIRLEWPLWYPAISSMLKLWDFCLDVIKVMSMHNSVSSLISV